MKEDLKKEIKKYTYLGSTIQSLGKNTPQGINSSDIRQRVDIPLDKLLKLFDLERKKTLEEVWNKYVKRCHFCKGEGIWRSETDGIEEINDCKICNGNGFFFESLKYETDLRELSKITKRGK